MIDFRAIQWAYVNKLLADAFYTAAPGILILPAKLPAVRDEDGNIITPSSADQGIEALATKGLYGEVGFPGDGVERVAPNKFVMRFSVAFLENELINQGVNGANKPACDCATKAFAILEGQELLGEWLFPPRIINILDFEHASGHTAHGIEIESGFNAMLQTEVLTTDEGDGLATNNANELLRTS